MAKLSFGMMQSLDGYVDGLSGALELGPPDPILFRHFVDYTPRLGQSPLRPTHVRDHALLGTGSHRMEP